MQYYTKFAILCHELRPGECVIHGGVADGRLPRDGRRVEWRATRLRRGMEVHTGGTSVRRADAYGRGKSESDYIRAVIAGHSPEFRMTEVSIQELAARCGATITSDGGIRLAPPEIKRVHDGLKSVCVF